MNLRNGNIRMQEIFSNPNAKAILVRELPQIMGSPLVAMAGSMTLSQVLSFAKGKVPSEQVTRILNQLKAI